MAQNILFEKDENGDRKKIRQAYSKELLQVY